MLLMTAGEIWWWHWISIHPQKAKAKDKTGTKKNNGKLEPCLWILCNKTTNDPGRYSKWEFDSFEKQMSFSIAASPATKTTAQKTNDDDGKWWIIYRNSTYPLCVNLYSCYFCILSSHSCTKKRDNNRCKDLNFVEWKNNNRDYKDIVEWMNSSM